MEVFDKIIISSSKACKMSGLIWNVFENFHNHVSFSTSASRPIFEGIRLIKIKNHRSPIFGHSNISDTQICSHKSHLSPFLKEYV